MSIAYINGLEHFAISTEDHDLGPSKRMDLLTVIVGAARKFKIMDDLGGCGGRSCERYWRAKQLKAMAFQVLENRHDQR